MPTEHSSHAQPLQPTPADIKHGGRRRLRYVLAALAIAVLLLWLAGPMLSNKIVPPSTPSESVDVAIVIQDGQAWLALPRPDGSAVAFAVAPRFPSGSAWDAAIAFVSARPGALRKSELSTTSSLPTAALGMQGQETWVIQAPQEKTFQLTAKLDALYAQNIASLTTPSNTGVRQVALPDSYSPLAFNTNQWAALQLRELGARVEGTGLLTRWSVQPTAP